MINMKSVILLCGGQSRRMGQDKGSMKIMNKPMINHILDSLNNIINEVIIVLNNKDKINKYKKIINQNNYTFQIQFTEDEIKNKGPLSGIQTGLKNISSNYALVLPCDTPFITKKHINNIFNQLDNNYNCIIPYHDDKNKLKTTEPLHGIYNKNLIPKIEEQLKSNILSLKKLIEKSKCKFIKIDNKKLLKKEFKNLNSPKDIPLNIVH